MKVLVIGGGGREHAVVWSLSKSADVTEVVCAPGVERRDLLDAALESALAAFSAQSPHLAGRYRS